MLHVYYIPCVQCKLPCVFTNNNKDQSGWRIQHIMHGNLRFTDYNNHPCPLAPPSDSGGTINPSLYYYYAHVAVPGQVGINHYSITADHASAFKTL